MAAACVLPTGEQKAAQEPVGQGTGSSSTTSAVISCHFIIHAVVLTSWFPEWHDYMKLGAFCLFYIISCSVSMAAQKSWKAFHIL